MFRISAASGTKKIIRAGSYEEFIENGCEKLGLNKENVRLYLSDGCEVDDFDGLQFAQEEKALIFMLEGEETLSGVSQPTPKSTTESVANIARPQWPITYRLPDLPLHLKSTMAELKDGKALRLNSRFVNSFLKLIMSDLIRYLDPEQPYVTQFQLTAVCDAISDEYPLLADKNAEDEKKFWRIKLIRRFKEYRSSLSPNEKLLFARTKYGRKRKSLITDFSSPSVVASSSEKDTDESNTSDTSTATVLLNDSCNESDDSPSESFLEKSTLISVVSDSHENSDELLKDLTQKSVSLQDSTIHAKVKFMTDSFNQRIHMAQNMTVKEELEAFPLLQNPLLIYQQAIMVLSLPSKEMSSCYQCFPTGTTFLDVEDLMRQKLLHLYDSLHTAIKGFKSAKNSIDCGVISEKTKMKRGIEYCAIRLRLSPSAIFHEGIRTREDFSTVIVNGCSISVNGLLQAVSTIVLSFIAFNLECTVTYKDLVETLQCLIGVRRRGSTQKVRNLLTSL